MELMLNYDLPADIGTIDFLCVDLDSDEQMQVDGVLSDKNLAGLAIPVEALSGVSSRHEVKVLVVYLSADSFKKKFNDISDFKNQRKATTLLVIHSDLSTDQVSQLLSEATVFSVIGKGESLKQSLLKALEHSTVQQGYLQSLQKVKNQNKTLESLKENLEGVVFERTKKDLAASQQMETSVKELQSILSFIKNVSRLESIEELMVQVRQEFKKIHALMPPILMVAGPSQDVRAFYFQGKQLIEKLLKFDPLSDSLFSTDDSLLRKHLSNVLGRPFGHLSKMEFNFHSAELEQVKSLIVFEHSLGEEEQSEYAKYWQQRWPIVNMALESLLLKESLQRIARQWARTFNNMADPIVIVDSQFRMSLSNSGFHTKNHLTCYQAFADRETPCKDCPIADTFATGEPKTADIRVADKIFRVHSYPIKLDDHHAPSHVINQYVDITQTIDLQSKVIQGEKMAAVGLLAGNIAHELNNPLTGIFSLVQLLLEDLPAGSSTHSDLTEIMNASARCQRIIKDLLEFSSVGEGSHAQSIDVNVLLNKTLPLLKMAMRMLNSELNLHSQPLRVKANPQLLQQVLFNLINNACQAMDEGGQLTVTTECDGDWAKIRIADTGTGIPAEIRDSIFDPFFTTKSEGKGTGLGLSMSKSVVERAGGRLRLSDDLKTGTEFIITLPLVSE